MIFSPTLIKIRAMQAQTPITDLCSETIYQKVCFHTKELEIYFDDLYFLIDAHIHNQMGCPTIFDIIS